MTGQLPFPKIKVARNGDAIEVELDFPTTKFAVAVPTDSPNPIDDLRIVMMQALGISETLSLVLQELHPELRDILATKH